jgi:hypothetical protein
MRLMPKLALLLPTLLTPEMASAAEPAGGIPAAAQPDSRIDPKHAQDVLELQRLKALYFYHLDHKNWAQWRALFADDAKLLVDRNDEKGKRVDVTEGADKLVAYTRERLEVTPSVHHGHTPLYAFQSATEASGIWAMADIISYDDQTLYGYGHYRETYRKENGVWKFNSVHLTRLKVELVPKK